MKQTQTTFQIVALSTKNFSTVIELIKDKPISDSEKSSKRMLYGQH